jgi:hypothetical protein
MIGGYDDIDWYRMCGVDGVDETASTTARSHFQNVVGFKHSAEN